MTHFATNCHETERKQMTGFGWCGIALLAHEAVIGVRRGLAMMPHSRMNEESLVSVVKEFEAILRETYLPRIEKPRVEEVDV